MSNGANIVSPDSQSGIVGRPIWLAALALAVATVLALLIAEMKSGPPPGRISAQKEDVQVSQAVASALLSQTSGTQSEILSRGESAERRNALIPLSRVPLERLGAFHSIPQGTPAYETALKCLTQAVYYEAADEPVEGQRAVAQVVLNRVRHPAFPDSVCGVVYQGSDDAVCQFSFTCDGSLLRNPLPVQWAEARKVAAAALDGFVETSVGTATSYHADYVVPRWAYTLGKIDQLGHHIFYRFRGDPGDRSFLTAHWSGTESIPKLDFNRWREQLAAADEMQPSVDERFASGLTVPPLITDRHAKSDVGGRIDMTKAWRPSVPNPVQASGLYVQAVDDQGRSPPNSIGANGSAQ